MRPIVFNSSLALNHGTIFKCLVRWNGIAEHWDANLCEKVVNYFPFVEGDPLEENDLSKIPTYADIITEFKTWVANLYNSQYETPPGGRREYGENGTIVTDWCDDMTFKTENEFISGVNECQ